MMQALRESSKSVVAIILFIILIVSFAIWGIGDIFRDSARDPIAAEVGEIQIHSREVRDNFNRELEQLQQEGRAIGFEQAVQLGLPNIVLERLIGDALRQKLATDYGLTITDDVIRAAVINEPGFQNQLGVFDRQIYQYFLQRMRLTEAMHIAQIRRDFGASQLFGTLEDGIPVPDAYRDMIYRFRFERRVAKSTLLPLSAVAEAPTPTDSALREFYDANKTAFARPEFRKLNYVYVRADDVLAEINVSDQRLKEEYEIRLNEFTTPEVRTVDQVLLSDEAKALELAGLVSGGAAFADAARQVLGRDGVIPLGEVTKVDLPPGLDDPVFELPLNGTTQPIRSPLGWHVLKVNAIKPAVARPIEEVRDQLAESVRRTLAPDLLIGRANDFERQLNRGTPLEEAARGIGATMKTVEAIDVNGGGPNGLPATDIADVRELTRCAFNMRKGDESALTELGNGDFFVFQVVDIIPARIPELAEIRDDVASSWQQVEIVRLATEKAKALVEQANGGGDFAALLKAQGLEAETTPGFTRSFDNPAINMPRELVAAIFAVEKGNAAYAATEGGIAIALLEEIQPADPATDAAGVQATRDQMGNALRETVRFALDRALRQRYPVRIDNAVMAQAFATER